MKGLKNLEQDILRRPPIIDNTKVRNRKDLPDSPRRLLDCLAAYKDF